jgi:hypothetical protein
VPVRHAALALATVALAVLATTPTASAAGRCTVAKNRTVQEQTSRWRLTGVDNDWIDSDQLVACNRRTGRTWTVATSARERNDGGPYDVLAVRGDWLLFQLHVDESEVSHEGGDEWAVLRVANLAHHVRRKVTSYVEEWSYEDDETPGSDDLTGTRYTGPVLDSHGNVAWLEPHAVRLLRRAHGRARTLDADPGATFGALRISRGRVRWTRDGVSTSAKL